MENKGTKASFSSVWTCNPVHHNMGSPMTVRFCQWKLCYQILEKRGNKDYELSGLSNLFTIQKYIRSFFYTSLSTASTWLENVRLSFQPFLLSSIEYAIYGMTRFDEIMGADDKVAVLQELAEQYFCLFTISKSIMFYTSAVRNIFSVSAPCTHYTHRYIYKKNLFPYPVSSSLSLS